MQIKAAVGDRKAQIIEATVTVLAGQGYEGTTFARIVAEARLSSTRLITYHFETKQDLLAATLRYIGTAAQAVMVPRVEAEPTARGKLSAYLRSNLGFLAEHPAYAQAAVQIARHLPVEDPQADLGADVPVVLLAQLFVAGQASGELRGFDPMVMAVTVRAAIDAAVDRFAQGSRTDLAAYADQLCELFDRAVRPEQPGGAA
jgi:AcrR family transcriptional regulator